MASSDTSPPRSALPYERKRATAPAFYSSWGHPCHCSWNASSCLRLLKQLAHMLRPGHVSVQRHLGRLPAFGASAFGASGINLLSKAPALQWRSLSSSRCLAVSTECWPAGSLCSVQGSPAPLAPLLSAGSRRVPGGAQLVRTQLPPSSAPSYAYACVEGAKLQRTGER